MLPAFSFQPGASIQSALPAAEPLIFLSLLMDVILLYSALVFGCPSCFLIMLNRLCTLHNLHSMHIPPHVSGLSTQRTNTCGTVDRESHASHILYAAECDIRKKWRAPGSALFEAR